MTAQEQLRHAAALIEEKGHVQCRWRGDGGEICLATALAEAAGTMTIGGVTLPAMGDYYAFVAQLEATPVFTEKVFSSVEQVCEINNEEGFDAVEFLTSKAAELDSKEVPV